MPSEVEPGIAGALREVEARWDAELRRPPGPRPAASSEVWTTVGWRWGLRQLINERDGVPQGRVLDKPPTEPDEFKRYGFDAEGRLLWIELAGPPSRRPVDLRDYTEDRAWEIRRDAAGEVQSVTRAAIRDGRTLDVVFYARSARLMNFKMERYTRDDTGEVVRIDIASWDRVPNDSIPSMDSAMVSVEDVIRRADGTIERIDHTFASAKGPMHRTIYVGTEDVEKEARRLLRELRAAMRLAVRDAVDQRDPGVCAIAVRYDAEDALPPFLVHLSRAELAEMISAGEDWLDPAVWDAAGDPHTIALSRYGFADESVASSFVRAHDLGERVADAYTKAIKDAVKDREGGDGLLAVYAVPFGVDPEPWVQKTVSHRVRSALGRPG